MNKPKDLQEYLPKNGFMKIAPGMYQRGTVILTVSSNENKDMVLLEFNNGQYRRVLRCRRELKSFFWVIFGEKIET